VHDVVAYGPVLDLAREYWYSIVVGREPSLRCRCWRNDQATNKKATLSGDVKLFYLKRNAEINNQSQCHDSAEACAVRLQAMTLHEIIVIRY
jgi:hypothetical protein